MMRSWHHPILSCPTITLTTLSQTLKCSIILTCVCLSLTWHWIFTFKINAISRIIRKLIIEYHPLLITWASGKSWEGVCTHALLINYDALEALVTILTHMISHNCLPPLACKGLLCRTELFCGWIRCVSRRAVSS